MKRLILVLVTVVAAAVGLRAQDTACGSLQLPYYETFADMQPASLPDCWLQSGADDSATDQSGVYVMVSHSGNFCLRLVASADSAAAAVALPPFGDGVGYVTVDFWAAANTDISAAMLLALTPDADSIGTLTPVWRFEIQGGGSFHHYSATFNIPAGGPWRLALVADGGNDCFVDDLGIALEGTCRMPQGLVLDWADSTAAHISWLPDTDNVSWLVRIGPDDYLEQDSAQLLIAPLGPDSTVHVELRAICPAGDTTDAVALDFRTSCSPQSLPLTEDFNSYRDGDNPFCWTVVGQWTDAGGSYPHVQSVVDGVEAFYRLAPQNTSSAVGLISPAMAPTDERLHVGFSLAFTGPGTFMAGIMTHPDSAMQAVLTIENTEGDASGQMQWTDYEFYTDTVYIDPEMTYYVGFMWTGTSVVMVDNIFIEASGVCHAPTSARIDSVWADSVSLSWVDYSVMPSGYELRYGAVDDLAEADLSLITNEHSVVLGDLEPSSTYSFWLRALCPDDSVRWLFVGTANTECGSANLPYRQSFTYESGTKVPCWLDDSPNTYLNTCSVIDDKLRMTSVGIDTLTVATPILRAPADELYVTFFVDNINAGILEAGVIDDTLGTFYNLYTVYTDGMGQTHGFYTDQLPVSDTMRVAFRLIGIHPNASNLVNIDDLVVRHQLCHNPEAVWIDSIDQNTAYVHVYDPTDVGFYRYSVEHDSVVQTIDATDTVVTLTMLEPGVPYSINVAAICHDGSTSEPVGTLFRTYCPYIPHIDLPYVQDFAQYASPDINPDVMCWHFMHFGSSHTVDAETGALGVQVDNYTSRAYVALPGVDVVSDLLLRFKAQSTDADFTVEVGVMTHPDDDVTFFPLDTLHCPATGSWHTLEALFSLYEGQGHWPAIRITTNSQIQANLLIDDVWLGVVPVCSGSIERVNVSNVWSYSADIEWNVDIADNHDASYTIHIVTDDGQHVDDVFLDSTSTTICNLTELTSYRAWIEMYCGGDVQAFSDTVCFMTRCDNTQSIEQSAFSNHITPPTMLGIPVDAQSRYSASQQLFTADELGNMPATITALDFLYHNDIVAFEVENCSIFISPCYIDTLTEWQTDGSQLVYSGPLRFVGNDWNTLYFYEPYEYDGVSNLLLTFVAESRTLSGVNTFSGYNVGRSVTLRYVSDDEPFVDTMQVYTSYIRSNIRFHICPGEVPTCLSPVLGQVVASSDYISISYDAGGDMCQTSISGGWIWHGDVHSIDNSGSYTFGDLEPVSNYIVGVRRMCPGMTSNWATRVVRTTQIVCDQPTHPVATDVTSTEATIGFSTNGSADWQLHLFNFRIDTVIDLTDSVMGLTGLDPDVTYHVAVRSRCGLGLSLQSEWSDTLDFTTGYCRPVATASVVADGLTAAVVSWTDSNASSVDHYRVEYGLRDFVRGEAIGAVDAGGTSVRIDGLDEGQMYDFYVAAVCDDGSRSVWTYAGGVPPVGIASALPGEPRLALQPNPASGTVMVVTPMRADLTFYDLEGRIVMRSVCDGGAQAIDISMLSPGTYFVRSTTPDGSTVGKLVVR